jgi:hypothetical protein
LDLVFRVSWPLEREEALRHHTNKNLNSFDLRDKAPKLFFSLSLINTYIDRSSHCLWRTDLEGYSIKEKKDCVCIVCGG